jgi:hypothetical protein
VGNAQTQHVGHDFLREWQREAGFLGTTDSVETRVKLKEEMRQPLDRRAAADIDDVLGIGRRFLHGDPAQSQAKLRPAITELHIGIERADIHRQIGNGAHGVDGALDETARYSHKVARQEAARRACGHFLVWRPLQRVRHFAPPTMCRDGWFGLPLSSRNAREAPALASGFFMCARQ